MLSNLGNEMNKHVNNFASLITQRDGVTADQLGGEFIDHVGNVANDVGDGIQDIAA